MYKIKMSLDRKNNLNTQKREMWAANFGRRSGYDNLHSILFGY